MSQSSIANKSPNPPRTRTLRISEDLHIKITRVASDRDEFIQDLTSRLIAEGLSRLAPEMSETA